MQVTFFYLGFYFLFCKIEIKWYLPLGPIEEIMIMSLKVLGNVLHRCKLLWKF